MRAKAPGKNPGAERDTGGSVRAASVAAPPAPRAPASRPAAEEVVSPVLASQEISVVSPAPVPAPSSWLAGNDGLAPAFPEELVPRTFRPYVAVRSCSQAGVGIAFDARCLEHEGFRASMPMRDLFSRAIERTGLIARPMAFIDRSGATLRSVQAFDAKYEQTVLPGWKPFDLLHVMATAEGLPRPFNLPVPYYVGSQHSQLSLQCQTTRRPDGGFTCEVLFPHGDYALEWLGRVNGFCGPEYQLLEQELNLIHADAWNQLPEVCRQRIVVWCHFRARERFIQFIPDAEFAQHEMGLAGLVVTSQRIVYQKNHHSGAAELRDEALLVTRSQDGFCDLTLQNADHRTRVVRIDLKDLPALTATLADHSKVRVVAGNEA